MASVKGVDKTARTLCLGLGAARNDAFEYGGGPLARGHFLEEALKELAATRSWAPIGGRDGGGNLLRPSFHIRWHCLPADAKPNILARHDGPQKNAAKRRD